MEKQNYTAPVLKVHGSIAELTHMPTKTVGDTDGYTLIIPGMPPIGLSGSTCCCN